MASFLTTKQLHHACDRGKLAHYENFGLDAAGRPNSQRFTAAR